MAEAKKQSALFKKYPLKPEDRQRLRRLLGREPGAIETALAMALWNEHCSYRSSRAHLKKFQFPTGKKISSIGENAGVVDLGEGEAAAFKMESHNHPSHIVPYHGAATGAGGILRDIFAMGARPLALADYLCFGPPESEGGRSRVDGVVRGIGGYGNCMGIPTITGRTAFARCYKDNILVNAMAIGLLKYGAGKKAAPRAMSAKAQGPGNYVVYAGAATGRDGILGASMASASFGAESAEGGARPAVQIGDPFFGKQLMEACLEAMGKGLVLACQDMGAAGLSCSSFEMASKGKLGFRLHLDRTPLRDPSMGPEEILLSESQERMLFVCAPSNWEPLKKIFERQGLEIAVLGEVLRQKEMELFWKGRLLSKIDPSLFTEKAPLERRPFQRPEPAPRAPRESFYPRELFQKSGSKKRVLKKPLSAKKLLLNILGSPEGRSRAFIYRQYDQRVGANTLRDASYPIGALRLPESGRELAFALGCRQRLMETDVEQGAKDAVFYPALQLSLRGFTPWAVTDCLNFGNPEKPEIMGEFVLSVESLAAAARALDAPVISGNVSFYNETGGRSITPTPAAAVIGLKESPSPLPPAGFARRGERVWLLCSHQFWLPGAAREFLPPCLTDSSRLEEGPAAQKAAAYGGGSRSPAFGALQEPLVRLFLDSLRELSGQTAFSAARAVGKFGLPRALARMVLEKGIGFRLDPQFPLPLWEERLYEAVVSVPASEEGRLKRRLSALGVEAVFLGETAAEGSDLILEGGEAPLSGKSRISFSEMSEKYHAPWEGDLSL